MNFLLNRLRRGWGFNRLGPQEQRIGLDFAAGLLASLGLGVAEMVDGSPARWVFLGAAAISIPGCNLLLGIYGSQRTAGALRKLFLLVPGCLLGALWLSIGGLSRGSVLLWCLMAYVPLGLARILSNLPFAGRRALLISSAPIAERKVLVTGGAGYIGTETVDLLLKEGFTVTVLDRLLYGRDALREFMGHPRFSLVEGDVADVRCLTAAMKDCSGVVHLAGLVGDPACAVDPVLTRQMNVISSRLARDIALALGVRRFIFASSCSVYGASDVIADERSRPHPVSLYAQTKLDSETELLSQARDHFFVTILRFATVFGHSRRPRLDLVANLFCHRAVETGALLVTGPDQWRPFVHVRDLARSIHAALVAPESSVQAQILNVGDDRLNLTIGQLGSLVRDLASSALGLPVRVQTESNSSDRRNYRVSFEKIRSLLAFQSTVSLEAGIREMLSQAKAGAYRALPEHLASNLVATHGLRKELLEDPLQASVLYTDWGGAPKSP